MAGLVRSAGRFPSHFCRPTIHPSRLHPLTLHLLSCLRYSVSRICEIVRPSRLCIKDRALPPSFPFSPSLIHLLFQPPTFVSHQHPTSTLVPQQSQLTTATNIHTLITSNFNYTHSQCLHRPPRRPSSRLRASIPTASLKLLMVRDHY